VIVAALLALHEGATHPTSQTVITPPHHHPEIPRPGSQVPLRGASAQFLTSGSYHTLADQVRVGWHPEFAKLFGSE